MASLKSLEARIRKLEGKKGSKRSTKRKKTKQSAASKLALKRLNTLAKGIQKKNKSWKRPRVMKAAGVKYRAKYC